MLKNQANAKIQSYEKKTIKDKRKKIKNNY